MASKWRYDLWESGWANGQFDLAARSPTETPLWWFRRPEHPQRVYAWLKPAADMPWVEQSWFSVAPNTWAEFVIANGRPDG